MTIFSSIFIVNHPLINRQNHLTGMSKLVEFKGVYGKLVIKNRYIAKSDYESNLLNEKK